MSIPQAGRPPLAGHWGAYAPGLLDSACCHCSRFFALLRHSVPDEMRAAGKPRPPAAIQALGPAMSVKEQNGEFGVARGGGEAAVTRYEGPNYEISSRRAVGRCPRRRGDHQGLSAVDRRHHALESARDIEAIDALARFSHTGDNTVVRQSRSSKGPEADVSQ